MSNNLRLLKLPYLLVYGDVEDEKEEEGDESMDDKVEVDAVDLDIGLVSPKTCGNNIPVEGVVGGVVCT